jgi:hypothetical protein
VPAQSYKPVLYIEPSGTPDDAWRTALATAIAEIAKTYPGVETKDLGGRWELVIPDKYKAGHEAHSAR